MKINKLNEQVNEYTLANGLTVYIYDNPQFEKMYANYTVNFGSIDTEYQYEGVNYTDPKGIAHYLEHLMFADGENDYFDYFAKLGAQSNAYTSFTQTSYLFTASSNYIKCLKILLEMVQSLKINEKRVKSEFGVIKEEIEMYNSKPDFILQNKIFASSCQTNYKDDIAGTVKSISEINYDHIKRLFHIFYAPSNATLFIAGNIDFDIEDIVKMQLITAQKPVPLVRRERETNKVNSSYNLTNSDLVTSDMLMTSFKFATSSTIKDMILADIATEIFLTWITSDLNPNYSTEIDNGQINETLNGYHMLDKTINMLVLKMRSDNAEALIDYINRQVKTLPSEVVEALRRKKIGSEIRLFSNPENISEFILDLILRDIDVNEYFDTLYTISADEIMMYINKLITSANVSIEQLSNIPKDVK